MTSFRNLSVAGPAEGKTRFAADFASSAKSSLQLVFDHRYRCSIRTILRQPLVRHEAAPCDGAATGILHPRAARAPRPLTVLRSPKLRATFAAIRLHLRGEQHRSTANRIPLPGADPGTPTSAD